MADERPPIANAAKRCTARRHRSSRRRVAMLMIGGSVTACVEQSGELVLPGEPAADCSARVIVGFERDPDAELLADVGRAADARLEVVGTLMPDLYVLTVSVDGLDSACVAAVERLRGDPRVRSVDVDARRGVRGP